MEWIERSQKGDGDAFAVVYDQYKNLVYRTAYLMLGDAGQAEDALQEVFMKVYRAIASYDPRRGAFTTWLYRITANHCVNVARAQGPDPLPIEAAGSQALGELSAADDGLAGDRLDAALDRLSVRLRAVVVLRYYAGLSYAEIGEALDLPLGTVKSRLNAALAALRGDLRRAAAPDGFERDARKQEVTR